MTAVETHERRVSLSRGPALALGTILLAAGLYFLYKQHTFVKLSSFPSGNAGPTGKVFLGIFGVNGWTGELTAVAGGLLLFGAAHHLLAKTMSLIVGVVLGVVAVWALVNHHSALGLFGAGIWTIIGYGVVAVLLLFNTLTPRYGGRRRRTEADAAAVGAGATGAGVAGTRAGEVPERRVATPGAVRSTPETAGPTSTTGDATRVRPAVEAPADEPPA